MADGSPRPGLERRSGAHTSGRPGHVRRRHRCARQESCLTRQRAPVPLTRLAREGWPPYPRPVQAPRREVKTGPTGKTLACLLIRPNISQAVRCHEVSTPDPFDHAVASPTFSLAVTAAEILSPNPPP